MIRFLRILCLITAFGLPTLSSAVQCKSFLKSDSQAATDKLVKNYIMFNLAFPQIHSGIILGSLSLILTGQTDFQGLRDKVFSGENIDYLFKVMTNTHKAHGVDPEGLIGPDRVKGLALGLGQMFEERLFSTLTMLLPEVMLPPVEFKSELLGQINTFQKFIDSDPSVDARLQGYGKTILDVLRSKEMQEISKTYRAKVKMLLDLGADPLGPSINDLRSRMDNTLRRAVSDALKDSHPELRRPVEHPLYTGYISPIADFIGF